VSAFGTPRLDLRVVDSTNDRARELAEAGAPSGTVVTADSQTAGRGRHGRRWAAPPGRALLLSALLRPLDARHGLLPLAVPVAVCEAIESVAPVQCTLKWPNDVWIDERKVAGVLIEARPPEWAVIGVGVNVAVADEEFPADLRWPATSVGHGAAVDSVRDALCDRLGEWVEAPMPDVLASFEERDALRGRVVTWEGQDAGASAIALGVDERGNLLVERQDGERLSLGSGEIQLRLVGD
jgi:BirA family transcriptional regulator, biotin operon repressor / biotin---[acetyl-CoA-carboxylase] ligase